MNKFLLLFAALPLLWACKKETPDPQTEEAKVIFRISVDPSQERLDNLGQPAAMPAGHAGQDPDFYEITAHYLELAPSAYTQLGDGAVLYHAPEVTTGGDQAIDFSQRKATSSGDIFLEVPISQFPLGDYEWIRLSLAYQNYGVAFYYNNQAFTGRLASFVGYNTYIDTVVVDQQSLAVNANKLQGFWAFETPFNLTSGQAAGTTVPNPLAASSPIPAGSCVVTGQLDQILSITGNETEDIEINMSLSTNKSFEWEDLNGNGKWDVGPNNPESVVDMGLRGLKAFVD